MTEVLIIGLLARLGLGRYPGKDRGILRDVDLPVSEASKVVQRERGCTYPAAFCVERIRLGVGLGDGK